MVFASPLFLFAFLPLVLAAYFAAPTRARNGVLLVASLAFYVWGEGAMLALVAASVLVNWRFGIAIAGAEGDRRRRRLAAAIVANLGLLAVFKYAGFVTENVDTLLRNFTGYGITAAAIPLPLGISFFTFHAISYVVDVHKRNARAEPRLPDFALYILLFPQLIAGPIIRWRDIAAQIPRRDARLADFAWGVRRFVIGLAKKVLIANTLGAVADQVFALPAGELTTPVAWLGLACYTLQIYFDFSGYSDMAIGLMRLFGFRILENFDYPYISRSVREFWRRWHISLSNWFRDYVYIPLGGNRRGQARAYLNLVIVFLLCGLWHGASWNFILWGAWHGVFLVIERAGLTRELERWRPLGHVYALLVVMAGWVLFRSDTLDHASAYFMALAGRAAGDGARMPLAQYVDPLVALALGAGIIGSMPVARSIARWRARTFVRGATARVAMTLDTAWLVLIGWSAAAWLAAGTYNPFIYFRF
ncbi:MAG: MBOAT family protein [Casimicrobiaceae bacterium]